MTECYVKRYIFVLIPILLASAIDSLRAPSLARQSSDQGLHRRPFCQVCPGGNLRALQNVHCEGLTQISGRARGSSSALYALAAITWSKEGGYHVLPPIHTNWIYNYIALWQNFLSATIDTIWGE
jgi:hypothetical protein